jgi:hypothetical protein
MILIEEAIQIIQSVYSKGLQSKDSRLSNRHIYSAMLSARGTLIRQRINDKQELSSWIYQTIPCVELEIANINDCGIAAVNGCTILKSKYELPTFINSIKKKDLIRTVTTLDNNVRFDVVDYTTFRYRKGNKFTSGKPCIYIRNKHLFVVGYKILKAIPVDGIFQDPIEVFNFKQKSGCADSSCDCLSAYELEFPFDRELMSSLAAIAMKELILLFGQMKEDRRNNASDDSGDTGLIHQPQQDNNGG